MEHVVITIGREYGSGGRLIAQKVAEMLSLVYYDNEIIELAAQELGFDPEICKVLNQKRSTNWMYNLYAGNQMSVTDQIFQAQYDIIKHLAKSDSCIIVSHCADYILEDDPDVKRIFIYAPLEERIARVKDEYGEAKDDAKQYVRKQDKNRAGYYNYYTSNRWGERQNYDLMVNSSMGLDLAAKLIVDFVKGETEE